MPPYVTIPMNGDLEMVPAAESARGCLSTQGEVGLNLHIFHGVPLGQLKPTMILHSYEICREGGGIHPCLHPFLTQYNCKNGGGPPQSVLHGSDLLSPQVISLFINLPSPLLPGPRQRGLQSQFQPLQLLSWDIIPPLPFLFLA